MSLSSVPETVTGLHVVTDDAVLSGPDFVSHARHLVESLGPAVTLHLRGPGTAGGPLLAVAAALMGAVADTGSTLVVSDRVDVALCAGAHGVQLGRRSLRPPEARSVLGGRGRVGCSVHDAGEAREAAADAADWIVVGNVFETATHPGRPGGGTALVEQVVAAAAGIPVVAIGGVTPERVGPLVDAGARGVAVLGGVWGVADPVAASRDYLAAWAAAGGPGKEST